MERLRTAAGALRRGERGFTLVELLLAATMGLVVVGGAVTIFIGAIRSEPRVAGEVASIQQARVAMERLTRELRQGLDVPTATASQLEIITYVNEASCDGAPSSTKIPCRVTYTCAAGACSRVVAQPDGTAPGGSTQVINGLASDDVFSYGTSASTQAATCDGASATSPVFVCVSLQIAGSGDPIVLSDGVVLRNPAEEES